MAATLAVAAAPTPPKSTETHSAQKSATCLFGRFRDMRRRPGRACGREVPVPDPNGMFAIASNTGDVERQNA